MLTLFKKQEDLGLFSIGLLILSSWPRYIEELMIKITDRVFPWRSNVKTFASQMQETFDSGRGAQIPQTSWPKTKA